MSEILRRDFAELGRVAGWKLNLGTPEDRRRALLRAAKKLREARAEELGRSRSVRETSVARKRPRKAARLRALSRKCWRLWESLPEVDGGAPWGWASVSHGRHRKQ
jgi:hypothetical protein